MSDASYSIDIAATMPAGEATVSQLESLGDALLGAAAQSTKFFQQIQQLSGAFDTARAASSAANASLAEGNAQYRELERAANVAAKAAERAAASGKLDPLQSKKAFEANAALEAYGKTLAGLEASAAGAAAEESRLSQQLEKVRLASKTADAEIAKQARDAEAAGKASADAGDKSQRSGLKLLGFGEKFDKLGEAMGTSQGKMLLFAGATVGVVVAVVAITAAVIAGTIAIAAWAVGLADSAREAGLAQEAAEIMTPEIEGLHDAFEDLTSRTGLTEAALSALAKQLVDAKVPTDELEDSLHTAALAQAALGAAGSAEFVRLSAAANEAARAAEEAGAKMHGVVPKDLKKKVDETSKALNDFSDKASALEDVVAKKLRGIDAQSATFKKNIGALFGGLDIEPVLRGLERLGALFDQNTAAGQAIKFLFESVFQPLIDQADKAATVIEAFALGFLIGLTKVYIAIKPALAAAKEFFGFKDTSLADVIAVVTKAGEFVVPVFLVFAGILAGLAAAIGVVVGVSVAWTLAVYSMIAAVVSAGASLVGVFVNAFVAVRDYLSGLPEMLKQIGGDLMLGLANGITGGVSSVISAMTGAVGSAIDAAKHKLGIASPSKVFAEIGAYTGEGFAAGVDDSAPDAQAAMSDMVDPAPAAGKAGAPAAGGSKGPSVHIENLYLAGAKASEAETISLSEALTRLIQGDVAQLGGEAAPV